MSRERQALALRRLLPAPGSAGAASAAGMGRGARPPPLALVASALSLALGSMAPAAADDDGTATDGSTPELVACAAPTKRFCSTCDACCLDFSAAACAECVEARCAMQGNRSCVADSPGGCTAPCSECCAPWLSLQSDCDACVATTCATATLDFSCFSHGTAEHPAECTLECGLRCVPTAILPWHWLDSYPCLHACMRDPEALCYAVILPFLGRLVVDFVLDAVTARCLRPLMRRGKHIYEPVGRTSSTGSSTPADPFKMSDLLDDSSSWKKATVANDHSRIGALAGGALRLLLWHVLQPVLYFWVFVDVFPTLEPVQQILGCFVAAREVQYLLSVLVCTCINPAFLLVDVRASVRDVGERVPQGGVTFLVMYVVAPEKFVTLALFGTDSSAGFVVMFVSALLDLCGLGALCAGLGAGNLPPALAVGYTVTALEALFVSVGSSWWLACRNYSA